MCGFLFVARRNTPVDRVKFTAAFATMRHRGPDHSAICGGQLDVAANGGAHEIHWMAGHHRLSILDLDPRSHQPFRLDDDMLLFNGEIYNYHERRTSPPLDKAIFKTQGDTEVLFRGLQSKGYETLEKMNGMWAFVFLNGTAGKLLSGRDRFGKKPLFWLMDNEYVVFASTLGAIDAYFQRTPRCRIEAAQSFLTYGRLFPGADVQTHHAQIRQVPPSGTLTVDLSTWTTASDAYFEFSEGEQPEESSLRDLLGDSLRLRLVSDRPVGLLLSGGIDSSLLLSIAAATSQSDSMRYLIGDTGKSDDAEFARQSVKALGLNATQVEIRYAGQSFDRFLEVCRHQEKPFQLLGNSMAMGSMYEAVQSQGIPVAIDGTGGDELFGGYWDRYIPFAMREAIRKKDLGWLFGITTKQPSRLQFCFPPFPRSAGLTRLVSFGGLTDLAQFDVSHTIDSDPLSNQHLTFNQALKLDVTCGRLGEWLWQNDRNAMMHSVENRSPLLDYRLGAFLSTGYAAKFSNRWNKLELRRQFDHFRVLPTQWRVQKQGFRWDRRRFLSLNRKPILEAIAASTMVEALIDKTAFLDRAARDERYFRSALSQRLTVLAGLEAATGMTV